jgi:hypothetical protein
VISRSSLRVDFWKTRPAEHFAADDVSSIIVELHDTLPRR